MMKIILSFLLLCVRVYSSELPPLPGDTAIVKKSSLNTGRAAMTFAKTSTTSLIAVAAPSFKTLYVTFFPSYMATGYRIYGGKKLDRSDWTVIADTNNQPVTLVDGKVVIPFQTESPGYGFIGVKAYNQYGESGWGLSKR
jgi:hypothetical protein